MKYVLTGSIGHISKPVAESLINHGHQVSIITSNADRATAIEALGATALTGKLEDATFLATAFKGADAVYLMIPPLLNTVNWFADQKIIANNYAEAIKKSGIKNVVVLSSVGADMITGAGPVDGIAYLESKINEMEEVQAVYIRPGYFYYNLFSMIPLIKNAGMMGGNQPADSKVVLAHPADIADAVTQQLLQLDFKGKQVIYVGSDEKNWSEITAVLTRAINKDNIHWVEFTDEQSLNGMLQAGLPETIASGYVTMGQALRSGRMLADYWKNRPAEQGKIKLEDFAKDFATAFNNG